MLYKKIIFLTILIFSNCLSIDKKLREEETILVQSANLDSVKIEIDVNGVKYEDTTPTIIKVKNIYDSKVTIRVIDEEYHPKEIQLRKEDYGILSNFVIVQFGIPGFLYDNYKGYRWKYDSEYSIQFEKKDLNPIKTCHIKINIEEKPEYRRAAGTYALSTGIIFLLGGLGLMTTGCKDCSEGFSQFMAAVFTIYGSAISFGGWKTLENNNKKEASYKSTLEEANKEVKLAKINCAK